MSKIGRRPKRPVRVVGSLAYVPLTRGYEAVIDACDVPLVDEFNWYARPHRKTVYALRNDYSGESPRTVFMHRIIADTPDGFQTDHIDGNGLNNRRDNLRHATNSQNQHNRPAYKTNKSGFKGVCWLKTQKKWQAQISCKGKKHHLGNFDCPELAHEAYVAASKKLHGKFSKTE
jgi:hypothetical protein